MKGSAKWYDSGCSSWLLSHKRNMQSPVHVKWRLKVISPDLFALNSKATAPKNSAPPKPATVEKPELMDVNSAPTAPPIVTSQNKYRSLLQRNVSLNNGSDRRAMLTVESIQRNIRMNPNDMMSPPSMLIESALISSVRATARKTESATKYTPIPPTQNASGRGWSPVPF